MPYKVNYQRKIVKTIKNSDQNWNNMSNYLIQTLKQILHRPNGLILRVMNTRPWRACRLLVGGRARQKPEVDTTSAKSRMHLKMILKLPNMMSIVIKIVVFSNEFQLPVRKDAGSVLFIKLSKIDDPHLVYFNIRMYSRVAFTALKRRAETCGIFSG